MGRSPAGTRPPGGEQGRSAIGTPATSSPGAEDQKEAAAVRINGRMPPRPEKPTEGATQREAAGHWADGSSRNANFVAGMRDGQARTVTRTIVPSGPGPTT